MLQMLVSCAEDANTLLKGWSTVVILELYRESETLGGFVTNADFLAKSGDSAFVHGLKCRSFRGGLP